MTEINPIQISTVDSPSLNSTSSNQQAKPSIFTGNMSADDTTSGSSTKKTQKFNSDGTVTTSYDYDGDGKIDKEVIRDANGEQKEVIEYSYGYRTFEDGTKVPITKTEHEYWGNGKNTGSMRSTIINGKEVDREEFTFTDNGTNKTYAKYESGKLVSRMETSFYKDGEITEGSVDVEKEDRIYDENNQLETIIEYTYPKDTQGHIIANVEKETDVKTGEVTVTRYDENNPRILKGTVEIGH